MGRRLAHPRVDRPIRHPDADPAIDVEREIIVDEPAKEIAAGDRAHAWLPQIDAVDKIQPAVQQDHDIGLQPVIQLVLQTREFLREVTAWTPAL